MPVLTRKWPLLDYVVASAPTDGGLYALWHGSEMLFIGIAHGTDNIRACLLKHFAKRGAPGPLQNADHFSWELPSDAEARRAQILEDFKRKHGRLPVGNT